MIVTAIRAWIAGYECINVELPDGSTVEQLRANLAWTEPGVAVFGQKCVESQILQAGDRVEFLRELTADPKEVRRRRAASNPLPRTFRSPKKNRRQAPADFGDSDPGEVS